MSSLRVYVAGPYTKGDPCVNTRDALAAGDMLWALGFTPFVPHLSHFWHTITPRSWGAWLRWDVRWLEVCDALVRLPGESRGADVEVAEAVKLGIPVYHSVAEVAEARNSGAIRARHP
jgi:hypothetical protein